jgi:Ca2+-binding RTX toxin-like protein
MNYKKPLFRRATLAAGAVIATACASVLFAAPANAATTITLTGGVLAIDGDAADNGFIVGRTPAGTITLNGSKVLGGAATVTNVEVVRMDGAGGNDTLRFDESNGAMPTGKFIGGEGRDKLVGGSQADSLSGDEGIDRIDGGPGDDIVSMGDDSDEFTWNPGDGNDRVDGDAGKDTLLFNGSDPIASDGFATVEELSFDSVESRTEIRRDFFRTAPVITDETNVVSVTGFELVKANLGRGTNKVFFQDGFSGSDVSVLRVDVGPPNNDPNRDRGQFNTATFFTASFFNGTLGADRIRIGGSPAAGATVTGLGPTVVITRPQELSVFDGGGDDVIDAGLMAAGTVSSRLIVHGGAGNDTLVGHPGNDLLSGGDGDDRLEGRGGDDILDGGPGHNVVIP